MLRYLRYYCISVLRRHFVRTAGKATSLFFGRQYGDLAALTHGLSFFASRDNPAALSVLFQDGIAVDFQHP